MGSKIVLSQKEKVQLDRGNWGQRGVSKKLHMLKKVKEIAQNNVF